MKKIIMSLALLLMLLSLTSCGDLIKQAQKYKPYTDAPNIETALKNYDYFKQYYWQVSETEEGYKFPVLVAEIDPIQYFQIDGNTVTNMDEAYRYLYRYVSEVVNGKDRDLDARFNPYDYPVDSQIYDLFIGSTYKISSGEVVLDYDIDSLKVFIYVIFDEYEGGKSGEYFPVFSECSADIYIKNLEVKEYNYFQHIDGDRYLLNVFQNKKIDLYTNNTVR